MNSPSLTQLVTGVNWTALSFVLAADLVMLLLVVRGGRRVIADRRWAGSEGHDQVFASPLTPAVSVLIPAHDEEDSVLDTLTAALDQRYPAFEVVLVDDGSTDRTFALVEQRYGLVQITPRPTAMVDVAGQVLSVYRASTGDPLVVVRKTSVGRRSDALNTGLNYARHPLVCTVDAGSLLEPDALLKVARPFVEDPENVVGTGGGIRSVNGSLTERGSIVEPRLSPRWLVRIQAVEHLRSFLVGRISRADANAMLITSGSLAMFRRELVVEVGGLDPRSLAADAELVVRLQEYLRRELKPHRMVFVPETVCWTQVPETWAGLGRQRRRSSYGLAQLIWKHRRMFANRSYGAIGLVALPCLLVFELLGPLVELAGLVSLVAAVALGSVQPVTAAVLVGLVLTLGVLVSTAVVAIEEFTAHSARNARELLALLLAGALANLGYRQLHAWSRLRGLVAVLFRRPPVWARSPRVGFTTADTRPVVAADRR